MSSDKGAKFPRLTRDTTDLPAGSAIWAAARCTGGWMPFTRLGWRIIVPATLALVLLNIGAVKFVRDAYPADPFKSEALAKCIAGDPGFVRFFPDDRARCYARQPRQTRLESTSDTQQD
jgi:hypothetical protein